MPYRHKHHFGRKLECILNIGELNLAQAAFMGIGAYTSTLLVMKVGLSFWLALPTGVRYNRRSFSIDWCPDPQIQGGLFSSVHVPFCGTCANLAQQFLDWNLRRDSRRDEYSETQDRFGRYRAGHVRFKSRILLSGALSNNAHNIGPQENRPISDRYDLQCDQSVGKSRGSP